MLAVLTVAMHIIYKKIQSIHLNLLLDAGYNYLNKHRVRTHKFYILYFPDCVDLADAYELEN